MADETQEQDLQGALQDGLSGGISAPSQTSEVDPQAALAAASAREELTKLGLQNLADVAKYQGAIFSEQVLRPMQRLLEAMTKVLQEMRDLRGLMLQDAETQYAVTRVFSETLLIDETVRRPDEPVTGEMVAPALETKAKS